jgi:hypothetical protein
VPLDRWLSLALFCGIVFAPLLLREHSIEHFKHLTKEGLGLAVAVGVIALVLYQPRDDAGCLDYRNHVEPVSLFGSSMPGPTLADCRNIVGTTMHDTIARIRVTLPNDGRLEPKELYGPKLSLDLTPEVASVAVVAVAVLLLRRRNRPVHEA